MSANWAYKKTGGLPFKIFQENCASLAWSRPQKFPVDHNIRFLARARLGPACIIVARDERNRMVYNMSYFGSSRKKFPQTAL